VAREPHVRVERKARSNGEVRDVWVVARWRKRLAVEDRYGLKKQRSVLYRLLVAVGNPPDGNRIMAKSRDQRLRRQADLVVGEGKREDPSPKHTPWAVELWKTTEKY
jgi:hypothetical protein